jgi:UDP-glucose 4-epimerase
VTVPRWSYAVSKLHSEHLIRAGAEAYGYKFAIARLFGSYGPHHHLSWWGGPQSEFISRSLKKEKLQVHGDGSQSRSFIYIDDLVDGLARIITSGKSDNEIFNLSSGPGTEITVKDLAALVWKLVNGDGQAPLEYIPYSAFGNYEDVPRRTGDSRKAFDLLGFDPKTGLEEGLLKTIAWQRGAMGP